MEEKYFPPKEDPDFQKKIETAARWIANSSYLVAFTGAGISTESGLPDFRGPQGVWTLKDQGKKPVSSGVPWSEVAPNQGHISLVELQNLGILKFCISQNVDNLHLKSGIHEDKIAELHGNSTRLKCLSCDSRFTKEELKWDVHLYGSGYRTQKPVRGQPSCPHCKGRIISSVVNFGDPMPEREMQESEEHTLLCDVFLAIGSSLSVTPASDFPKMALQKKKPARLIILNLGNTALDSIASLHISAKAGASLEKIMPLVKKFLGK